MIKRDTLSVVKKSIKQACSDLGIKVSLQYIKDMNFSGIHPAIIFFCEGGNALNQLEKNFIRQMDRHKRNRILDWYDIPSISSDIDRRLSQRKDVLVCRAKVFRPSFGDKDIAFHYRIIDLLESIKDRKIIVIFDRTPLPFQFEEAFGLQVSQNIIIYDPEFYAKLKESDDFFFVHIGENKSVPDIEIINDEHWGEDKNIMNFIIWAFYSGVDSHKITFDDSFNKGRAFRIIKTYKKSDKYDYEVLKIAPYTEIEKEYENYKSLEPDLGDDIYTIKEKLDIGVNYLSAIRCSYKHKPFNFLEIYEYLASEKKGSQATKNLIERLIAILRGLHQARPEKVEASQFYEWILPPQLVLKAAEISSQYMPNRIERDQEIDTIKKGDKWEAQVDVNEVKKIVSDDGEHILQFQGKDILSRKKLNIQFPWQEDWEKAAEPLGIRSLKLDDLKQKNFSGNVINTIDDILVDRVRDLEIFNKVKNILTAKKIRLKSGKDLLPNPIFEYRRILNSKDKLKCSPGRIHGDLHLENIIVTKVGDYRNWPIQLIDLAKHEKNQPVVYDFAKIEMDMKIRLLRPCLKKNMLQMLPTALYDFERGLIAITKLSTTRTSTTQRNAMRRKALKMQGLVHEGARHRFNNGLISILMIRSELNERYLDDEFYLALFFYSLSCLKFFKKAGDKYERIWSFMSAVAALKEIKR